jgi:hypothetical protein
VAYVVMLVALWSAVGGLMFFVRADLTARQRLALTVVTSLVFGAVGWVDISSIHHGMHAPSAIASKAIG